MELGSFYDVTIIKEEIKVEEPTTHLDEILVKLKITGSYYLKIWPFLFLANVSNSISITNYMFTAELTGFRCKDDGFGNNTCTSLNDSDIVCNEWIYDDPKTFMAEFQLACDEWKTTLVGTAHSFGYMMGLLIVGPLSDRLGRKTTLAVTGLLGGILGIARSFTSWYWMFITLEFLEAAVGDVASPLYMLTIEMVSFDQRVSFQLMSGIGYSFGFLVLPFVAWLSPDWRCLLRIIYPPAMLIMMFILIMDESPRWLLSKGRKDEAVTIIQKMAEKNKVEIDKKSLDNLSYVKDNDKIPIPYIELLIETVTSPILVKRFLLCVCWWTVSCFVNFGLRINSAALHGDKYADSSIKAIVEAAGQILVWFLLMRYRRKMPLVYAFFLAALLCLPQPFVPDYLNWLRIALYICGQLMSSVFFFTTYMYTSELFPTYTRNSMHALCSSIGRIGSMVAPHTPLLKAYWEDLPAVVFGAASLLAGLVTLFAPDTADHSLPDTIAEAEALGNVIVRPKRKSTRNNKYRDSAF